MLLVFGGRPEPCSMRLTGAFNRGLLWAQVFLCCLQCLVRYGLSSPLNSLLLFSDHLCGCLCA